MKSLFYTILFVAYSPLLLASQVTNLYNFQGSVQGWNLAAGSNYADVHLCGDRLSSWIGCRPGSTGSIDAYGDALPADTPIRLQVNKSFALPSAIEFWADVSYYHYQLKNRDFYSRFYLLTQTPGMNSETIHFGNFKNLEQYSFNNNLIYYKVNLLTMGITHLSHITGMGLEFRANREFRGKVMVDNVWVRTETIPTPEPSTFMMLIGALSLCAISFFNYRRFRK